MPVLPRLLTGLLRESGQEAGMRQKTRVSRRRLRPEPPAGAAGQDPAEWVLVNEAGWGMPHWIVAAIAALYVMARAVGRAMHRRSGDPPRSDRRAP